MICAKLKDIIENEIVKNDDEGKLRKIEDILLEQLALVRNKRFKLKQESFQKLKQI